MTKAVSILMVGVLAITLSACSGGGDRSDTQNPAPTTPTTTATVGQGPCSAVFIIQGNSVIVRGDRGSSVTIGGTTINFSPTCNPSTTTAPAA